MWQFYKYLLHILILISIFSLCILITRFYHFFVYRVTHFCLFLSTPSHSFLSFLHNFSLHITTNVTMNVLILLLLFKSKPLKTSYNTDLHIRLGFCYCKAALFLYCCMFTKLRNVYSFWWFKLVNKVNYIQQVKTKFISFSLSVVMMRWMMITEDVIFWPGVVRSHILER